MHPMSVIFSFRCLIELLTTIPFLISVYIPNGQFLYGKVKCLRNKSHYELCLEHSALLCSKLGFAIKNQERHED